MDLIKNLPRDLQDLILDKVADLRLIDAEVAKRWVCLELLYSRVLFHDDEVGLPEYIQFPDGRHADFSVLIYVCINHGMFMGYCFVEYDYWINGSKDVHSIPLMTVEKRLEKGMRGWRELAGMVKKVAGQFVNYNYRLGTQNFRQVRGVVCKMIHPDWKKSVVEKRMVMSANEVGSRLPKKKVLAHLLRDVWEPRATLSADLFRGERWNKAREMEDDLERHGFEYKRRLAFCVADSSLHIDYEEVVEPFGLDDLEEIERELPEVFQLLEEHGLLWSKKRRIPKDIATLMDIRYKHGTTCDCSCGGGCRDKAVQIMIQYGFLDCTCGLLDYRNPCTCALHSFEIPKLHEMVDKLAAYEASTAFYTVRRRSS